MARISGGVDAFFGRPLRPESASIGLPSIWLECLDRVAKVGRGDETRSYQPDSSRWTGWTSFLSLGVFKYRGHQKNAVCQSIRMVIFSAPNTFAGIPLLNKTWCSKVQECRTIVLLDHERVCIPWSLAGAIFTFSRPGGRLCAPPFPAQRSFSSRLEDGRGQHLPEVEHIFLSSQRGCFQSLLKVLQLPDGSSARGTAA